MPGQRSASAISRSPSDVERRDVAADRRGELVGIDGLLADERRLQHLQIAPRQQRAGRRDVAGIAGELHAVFGGAERGGADAFAGRQHRPGQRARVDALADGAAEPRAHVAEIAALALVDVFGDAAGEHDAVDAAEIGDRIGQIEMLDVVRHRPRRDRGDQRVGHARRRPCPGRRASIVSPRFQAKPARLA